MESFPLFNVTVNDELVCIEHPKRQTEQIFWKDIVEIKLINTSSGPYIPDVWLALIGEESGCLIPQGCEGFDVVYQIVSKYENFNFENVIKSMTSTDDEEYLLWKKKQI